MLWFLLITTKLSKYMSYFFVPGYIKNHLIHQSIISICSGHIKQKLNRIYSTLIYFNSAGIVDWEGKAKCPCFLATLTTMSVLPWEIHIKQKTKIFSEKKRHDKWSVWIKEPWETYFLMWWTFYQKTNMKQRKIISRTREKEKLHLDNHKALKPAWWLIY